MLSLSGRHGHIVTLTLPQVTVVGTVLHLQIQRLGLSKGNSGPKAKVRRPSWEDRTLSLQPGLPPADCDLGRGHIFLSRRVYTLPANQGGRLSSCRVKGPVL